MIAANLAGGEEGLVGYLKTQAELVNPSAFMTGWSKLLPSLLEEIRTHSHPGRGLKPMPLHRMRETTVPNGPEGRPKIRIPYNWAPRDYQMNVWRYLERGGKRAICVWHRRAGKDDVCLHWAAASMIDKPATYWHMLPAFSQGRKAIWTAVNPHSGKRRIDEAFPHELRVNTNESEMFIRFKNGSTWQVVGSDRYDAAVGSSPAGITFSEWALSNPSAWAYLAPIVIENDGWALFITTARGRNLAKSMLDMAQARDDWFSEVLPVNVTNAMSEAAVEQQRLEYTGIFGKEAADALIDQEYYCSFFEAAILGAYWGKEMLLAEQQGRICDVPVNTEPLPVQTAWDIGVDDAMAIWCASRSTPITSTSWTITWRATVRASTTIANGSTSGAITAPTGIRTT